MQSDMTRIGNRELSRCTGKYSELLPVWLWIIGTATVWITVESTSITAQCLTITDCAEKDLQRKREMLNHEQLIGQSD